jgi:hypothetical protein
MKYIKTYEATFSKEKTDFTDYEREELEELGFVKNDLYYIYTPYFVNNFKEIKICKNIVTTHVIPTMQGKCSYQLEIIFNDKKPIKKDFPNIGTFQKILKEIGILAFNYKNRDFLMKLISYIIPFIEEDLTKKRTMNKFNL